MKAVVPIWIRDALSTEQMSPFLRPTRNASILAAAGSGKTRTLVHLVAADLASGVPPEGIVAFTFTEKAAEELLARIHALAAQQLAGLNLAGIYIGTIHAWCLKYLLEQADFYNVSSVDELHLDALVSRLYDSLDIEKAYGLPYPKGIARFLTDLEVFYNEHLSFDSVPARISSSIKTFLAVLQKNRLMTFGGMIRAATEHLLAHGAPLGLKVVYVDEYQDVNPAQVALVKAMGGPSTRVVAVGDDLQCIYQWRGSDVGRILEFSQDFADASAHRLTTNYRSRPNIVKIANDIAERIALRDPAKRMATGRTGTGCPEVHWLTLDAEFEQVEAVVEIVKRFAKNGVPWNRMAILLRSVSGSGQPFVDALQANDIPVVCPTLSRGGAFINQVALPLLDWLRKERPEPRNEVEEQRAEEAAQMLWLSLEPWVGLPKSEAEVTLWRSLAEWEDKINAKRSDAYDVRGRLYDLLDQCQIGIAASDSSLMVGLGITSQIIRSVEEIHRRRISGQPRRSPRGVVSEVYHALLRRQGDFGESIPIEQTGDGVLVSTVHQAKGLEWPVVILPMLVNRRFPVSSRPHGSSFPDEIAARYGTSLDDERRLFYVAATRARERLLLLDPMRRNEKRRSTFLHDLQEKGLTPKRGLDAVNAGTWHLSPEDLAAVDQPPLRIGISDLLLYLECPFQFGLRRVVGVEPSIGDELGFGQSLHELIERRLEAGRPWSDAELAVEAKKHVFLPYASEAVEEKSRRAIQSRIQEMEKAGLLTSGVEPEISVDVILEHGIVSGVIDLVYVNPDGSLLVRDWKSTIHDEFFDRYERQLQFYAFALRQQGRTVASADIVDVAASARGSIVSRTVDVSEHTTTRAVGDLAAGLQGIANGCFAARPCEKSCSVCDMSRVCGERGRT